MGMNAQRITLTKKKEQTDQIENTSNRNHKMSNNSKMVLHESCR